MAKVDKFWQMPMLCCVLPLLHRRQIYWNMWIIIIKSFFCNLIYMQHESVEFMERFFLHQFGHTEFFCRNAFNSIREKFLWYSSKYLTRSNAKEVQRFSYFHLYVIPLCKTNYDKIGAILSIRTSFVMKWYIWWLPRERYI